MPNKKQKTTNEVEDEVVDNSDSEKSIDSDELSDSDMSDGGSEVMINFEARALVESDADSIKLLMQQKLGNFGIDLNEIATILVQQEGLGNVIFQCADNEEEEIDVEDQTIFGVLSCINFNKPQVKDFVVRFKEFLIKECRKHTKPEIVQKFEEILRNKAVTYLVNERYKEGFLIIQSWLYGIILVFPRFLFRDISAIKDPVMRV
jgi:hypothetical protein